MWSFVENVDMNDKILEVGLESFDKIKRQLDVDIPRLNIVIDDIKINNKDQIITKDLNILRCCTQSIFFQPLSYLIKLFPDVHIIHEREKVKSSVTIYTKKYNSGLFSYIGWSLPNTTTDCTVSTYFSALRKSDMKCIFMIYMQFIFDCSSNIGTLFFQVKNIN